MDLYPDEASSISLIAVDDDDTTTVSGSVTATPSLPRTQVTRCGIPEHCGCSSLCCHSKELQLPANRKTIYESWTITYHRPRVYIKRRTKIFPGTYWLSMRSDPGFVMSVDPKVHFGQGELATVVDCTREQHDARSRLVPRSYDGEVERRLRTLNSSVQTELYKLLRDRTENASSAFRRREYKLAVLLEVLGGDMTDAGSEPRGRGSWLDRMRQRMMKPRVPHVEYRLILRGDEVRTNDAGWGLYDRYAKPWKLSDEAEMASVREKLGYCKLLD